MELLGWIVVFVLALGFLIKSSDFFIGAAEKIGLALGLSPVVIGTLILAFGTSIPELITSIIAVYSGASEVVLGNVVGSNIANISLVGGIMAVVAGGVVLHFRSYMGDLIFVSLAALLLFFFTLDREIVLWEGLVLLAIYIGYVAYAVLQKKPEAEEGKEKPSADWRIWATLIGGGIGIYLGADFTVRSIMNISEILQIGIDVISLTAVAFGTSLPELVVSLAAARSGRTEMALGNIIGSNVFNILMVVSIPSFLGNIVVPESVVVISIPVMLLVTVWLVLTFLFGKMGKVQGAILVTLYVLFNIELFFGIFGKYILPLVQ